MKTLLLFEYRKLFRRKSTYVILSFLVFFWMLNSVVSPLAWKALLSGGEGAEYTALSPFYSALSAASNTFQIILAAIFTILFACDDFSCGTFKNIYARGFSRMKVYLAKWIVCLCFAIVTALFVILATLLSVTLIDGTETVYEIGHFFLSLLGELLTVVTYVSFALMIAFVFRTVGRSVLMLLLITLAVSITLGIADIIIALSTYYSGATISASAYWFESFPATFADAGLYVTYPVGDVVASLILCFVYTATFFGLGLLAAKASEL